MCSDDVIDGIIDMAEAVPTTMAPSSGDVVVVVVVAPGVSPCTRCAAVSRASLMFSNWRAAFLPGTGRSHPSNSRTCARKRGKVDEIVCKKVWMREWMSVCKRVDESG